MQYRQPAARLAMWPTMILRSGGTFPAVDQETIDALLREERPA
jgi:hypothetical protein